MPSRVRLNKFLRDCQLGSRRKCEKLITDGLVAINDIPVTSIGTLVDAAQDRVEVDGKMVVPHEEKIYVAAYKPRGVLVTSRDPQSRKTMREAIADLPVGVFSVGRLDMNSEGLMILTNDGKLGFRLAHPRYGIERGYEVTVRGRFRPSVIEDLTRGIMLEDGMARATRVGLIARSDSAYTLSITLTEGRKREIRRMMAACGCDVDCLRRVSFGRVSIERLKPGHWRHLTRAEVRSLRNLVEEAYVHKLKEE